VAGVAGAGDEVAGAGVDGEHLALAGAINAVAVADKAGEAGEGVGQLVSAAGGAGVGFEDGDGAPLLHGDDNVVVGLEEKYGEAAGHVGVADPVEAIPDLAVGVVVDRELRPALGRGAAGPGV